MKLKIRQKKVAGRGNSDILASTAVIANKFIVFGLGDSDEDLCSSLCLSTWSWTDVETPAEFRRWKHCAVVAKDRYMVVYGGVSPEGHGPLGDTIRLDVRKLRWETIQKSREGREAPVAAVLDDMIFRFGGFNKHNEWMNDIHRMPVPANDAHKKMSWEFVETAEDPKLGAVISASMAAHGTSLFVLATESYLPSSLYEFETLNLSWTKITCPDGFNYIFPMGDRLILMEDSLSGEWRKNFALFDVGDQDWVPFVTDDGTEGDGSRGIRAIRIKSEVKAFKQYTTCRGAIGNGRLIVLTEHASVECFEVTIEGGTSAHESKSHEEFGREVWEDMHFTDVTFLVEETRIPAHRIICWQYPYFRSLFSHETAEFKTGEVDIKDVPAAIFREIMRYVYTGQYDAGALEASSAKAEDSNGVGHSLAVLVELLATADRFLMERMKDEIEDALISVLDDTNCGFLFSAGDRHNAPGLAEAAGDRMKEAVDKAMSEDPRKAFEAYEAMVQIRRRST